MGSRMTRIRRRPDKFGVLDLFTETAREQGLRLSDPESGTAFVETVSASFTRGIDNPAILHGRRVEGMFGFVAASLGAAKVVKQEDAGEVYATDASLKVPDYRIVTENDHEFLVEVKNRHRQSAPLKLAASYVRGLRAYGELFKRDVKVAIYWSRWNLWTLTDLSKLPESDRGSSISMPEAMKMNEMALLGDAMVGTKAPLVMRLTADKPSRINDHGVVQFTIGAVNLFCSGAKLRTRREKNLAFYFMLYGDWIVGEMRPLLENGQFVGAEFAATPEVPTDQGFEFVGTLSTMISNQYHGLTVSESGIEQLTPDVSPGSLGVVIPSDYKSKRLPLWHMTIRPNYDPWPDSQSASPAPPA